MLKYMVILGAIVSTIGSIIYIKDTLLGKTKPNKISRLIWSLAPFITTFSFIYSEGFKLSIIPVFMSGFTPFLIFLASFCNKKAYWKISKLDYICGILSIISIIIRFFTKDPILVIILTIIIDLLAGIPTLIKSWKNPETETYWAFLGGLFSASTTFFAISSFGFIEVGFPLYLLTINFTLSIIIIYGKKKKSIQKT